MPTFSIVVPVYKTEAYLQKCVDSITRQSCRDFELILVDDGSPDGCPALCDALAKGDDRIRVIHKQNGGVSSARNAALEQIGGTYVWFVDSDDTVEDGALECLLETLSKDDPDLLVFNTNGTEEIFDGDPETFFRKYYFTYVLGFAPWNKIYRADVIAENGLRFDTEETIGEDLLFNVAYDRAVFCRAGARKIVFLNKDLYHYVIRENSAMTTASKTRIVQQLRLFDKIQVLLKDCVSEETLAYFFILHLISGMGQSAGLTADEFAKLPFEKYQPQLALCRRDLPLFLNNEHASLYGKIRCRLFFSKMKKGDTYHAAKVMGLQ